MRCPIDNETLVMADRGGVEIDYCPKCRGVWLDRGELDKIIERSLGEAPVASAVSHASARPAAQPAPIYQPEPQVNREPPRRRDDDRDDDDHQYGRKKKRRESFLSDIFDF